VALGELLVVAGRGPSRRRPRSERSRCQLCCCTEPSSPSTSTVIRRGKHDDDDDEYDHGHRRL
jgi:hypothetical protein